MPLTEEEMRYLEAHDPKAFRAVRKIFADRRSLLKEHEDLIEKQINGHMTLDGRKVQGLRQRYASLKKDHYDYKARRWDAIENRNTASLLLRTGYALQVEL